MNTSTAKETAIDAANQAGSLIRKRLGNLERIDYKSAYNLVTDVDKASEKLILEILRASFPDDSILAEEGGGDERSPARRWLVDPLDGTTNFAHSYPFFAVSIALEVAGEVVVAVVYNPVSGELFTAEKGHGAQLNGKSIRVSPLAALSESLLATGFPPDTLGGAINNMAAFHALTNLSHGVRRDGSAALDLCYVACGRLEGFWEFKLAPWDIAAGSLIVQEAGGTVSAPSAEPLNMANGHILATNGKIHQALVEALNNPKVGASSPNIGASSKSK